MGQAQEVVLSVNVSQSRGLWQSEPPAFKDGSRGLGLSLGITYREFALSAGMSLLDLETFQTSALSSFDVSARWTIRQKGDFQVTAIGGLALLPDLNWTGPYAGVVGSHTPWPFLELWIGPIVQTTSGADCCREGTAIRLSAGIDLLFELHR
ncbi:MAG: hypothetical protein ABEK03_06230 [Candidatus Bipolaricaulia bacterium]